MPRLLKSREVIHVALNRIKTADYNPQRRTEGLRLNSLARSIEKLGLLYPCLINKANELIDGHRRLACAKRLEWKTIPCLVIDGERDNIYADVNATAAKLNGSDALGVWLKNPKALQPAYAAKFAKCEDVLGRDILDTLFKNGNSIRVYFDGIRVSKYCDLDGQVPDIVKWLLKHDQKDTVTKAIAAGFSPTIITKAIKLNRPIKFQIELG
jgi:hypothetical protein